jgi:hypothetical protein
MAGSLKRTLPFFCAMHTTAWRLGEFRDTDVGRSPATRSAEFSFRRQAPSFPVLIVSI